MGDQRTCVITFLDGDGMEHSVELTVESLYEAAITSQDRQLPPRWGSGSTPNPHATEWLFRCVFRITVHADYLYLRECAGSAYCAVNSFYPTFGEAIGFMSVFRENGRVLAVRRPL
jgi:hypothetical protein